VFGVAMLAGVWLWAAQGPALAQRPRAVAIDLWSRGQPAFGIYVPNENPGRRGRADEPVQPPAGPPYSAAGGERLAANPLYDFLFLNLEGAYDPAHVRAVVEGVSRGDAARRPALIVRIPPISSAGSDATAARVKEILSLGADGVTLPHIRSLDEAREAIGFFRAAGADVWSPANRSGRVIAMLMLEDPEAVAQAAAIADLPGFSILACGIGSLRSALGGNREAAEAGAERVLAESKRAGLVNMLTANTRDVEQRVTEGFLALLMQGPTADEAIRIGRTIGGRYQSNSAN
jgi:2-keto-3-deoxy-L-rhamnonate aldolase RhmA